MEADLGFGIMNEGDKIRLTIPNLTEENRRDLVKKLNDRLEKPGFHCARFAKK